MGRPKGNDPTRDLSPLGRAKGLAKKGIDGWWAGVGDRTITRVISEIAPSSAWCLWAVHFLRGLGVGMIQAIGLGFFVGFTLFLMISFYWGKKRTQRAVEASTQGAPQLPAISTPLGTMELSGIGIFRSISFRYVRHGGHDLFNCTCVVDFVGFRDVNASPLKLRLTTVGGADELATLEPLGSAQLKCPVDLTYEGRGPWTALMDVAEKTMWKDRPRTRPGGMPWSTTPISDSVYCDLEIRLPGIEQSEKHRESGVKLSFELAPHDHKSITVRIDPWSTLAPPTTSTTLL
jgi:hypothetical protein